MASTMKKLALLSLAAAIFLCAGCAEMKLYAKNRALDLLDVIQVNGGYSNSISLELKATDLITGFCGIGREWKVGCMGRDFAMWQENVWGVGIAGYREVFDWYGSSELVSEALLPDRIITLREKYNYFPSLIPEVGEDRNVSWVDRLNFELGMSLGIVNLRLGLGLGHIIDFFGGILHQDPGGDDDFLLEP